MKNAVDLFIYLLIGIIPGFIIDQLRLVIEKLSEIKRVLVKESGSFRH